MPLPLPPGKSLSVFLCSLHKGPWKKRKTDQWKWSLCLLSKYAEMPRTPRKLLPIITIFNPTIRKYVCKIFSFSDLYIIILMTMTVVCLLYFCHKWETLHTLMLKCEVTLEALRILCNLPSKSIGNVLDFTKIDTVCLVSCTHPWRLHGQHCSNQLQDPCLSSDW